MHDTFWKIKQSTAYLARADRNGSAGVLAIFQRWGLNVPELPSKAEMKAVRHWHTFSKAAILSCISLSSSLCAATASLAAASAALLHLASHSLMTLDWFVSASLRRTDVSDDIDFSCSCRACCSLQKTWNSTVIWSNTSTFPFTAAAATTTKMLKFKGFWQ